MNKFFISGLLLVFSFHGIIYGQDIEAFEMRLGDYISKANYTSYFNLIDVVEDSARIIKDPDQIEKNIILINYAANKLLQRFEALDNAEKLLLRKTAMYVAQTIIKLKGNYNEALEIYLIAHEQVEEKNILDTLSWFIENRILNIYSRKNDYNKAEYFSSLVESSLKHFGDNENLSRFYGNKGILLKSQNKLEEAITTLNRGLKLADSISFYSGIYANSYNLASLYNEYPEKGSPEIYLEMAETALDSLYNDSRIKEKKAALYAERAKKECFKSNYIEALQLYNLAKEELNQFYSTTHRREFAKYYLDLARLFIKMDQLDKADSVLHLSLLSLIPELMEDIEFPPLFQIYMENSFMELFQLKADILERRFQITADLSFLAKAITNLEFALYANDLIRDNVYADQSKLLSIQSNKLLIEKGITMLYRLYQSNPDSIMYNRIRDFFNRSKSLLYEEKSLRHIAVELMDPEDKETYFDLQKKIIELHDKKQKDILHANEYNGLIISYTEQMDGLISAYEHKVSTSNIKGNYLEYLVTGNKIYALFLIDSGTGFFELGSVDRLQELLARLEDYILLKNLSFDEQVLNDLYNFLVKPFLQIFPDQIVIIPDGPVGLIPFELLKDDKDQFLINNSTISYAFQYQSNDYPEKAKEKSYVIFCLNPQYNSKPGSNRSEERGSLYALPWAKIEVDSICAIYKNQAFTSESPDKAIYSENISKASIFHYAGHAIIKNDTSYLAFTGDHNLSNQLTHQEIGLMHHPVEMVVLSACETGLGKLENGEGIRSLGKSFMESGARSTIISLWNVNDEATAKIMTGFYKNLRHGMKKSDALRLSKLEYMRTSSGGKRHPYFWAAFIPAGNMCALSTGS